MVLLAKLRVPVFEMDTLRLASCRQIADRELKFGADWAKVQWSIKLACFGIFKKYVAQLLIVRNLGSIPIFSQI